MTLDTYSHVLIDEPAERLARLRRGVLVVFQGAGNPPRNEKSPAQTELFSGMEDTGLEPVTFALPARRSPS